MKHGDLTRRWVYDENRHDNTNAENIENRHTNLIIYYI